jgi:hypothetical protein
LTPTEELIERAEDARNESRAQAQRLTALMVRGNEIHYEAQALASRLTALFELRMLEHDFRVVVGKLARALQSYEAS